MAHPVYVLLPEGVQWSDVPGGTAQASSSVRWDLRPLMPDAVTQTAVLVPGEGAMRDRHVIDVAQQARMLGGVAIDGHTQLAIDPDAQLAGR